MTKVLFVSNDPLIFDAESAVYARMREYATLFDELHVISRAPQSSRTEIQEQNLTLYPVSGFLALYTRTRCVIRERGIDVVSAQDPFEYGLIAYFASRGTRAKLHIQLHTDMFSPYFRWHPLWNVVRLCIARFVFARAYGIRVISEHLKSSLEASSYKLKATQVVLPIFVDIERLRSAPEDAAIAARFGSFRTRILVVARLEPEKNVSLAIRAFAASAPRDSCLIIVGEGRERESLQRFAKRLNVEERVFFEGAQNAVLYYKIADLVLVTSHYEGYGLVIIEALASGVPVVATDVGIAREAGAIVAKPEEFADALSGWFKSGSRHDGLHGYPYVNKASYLEQFKKDLELCTKQP
ncbi:hypothetical protein A2673_00175 [Candidatus Kaiserbacteria bacterium RIFCSPHIGHO2_01_FULL_50_13]|uniref:Glycosyl transferase family 1 domain-containing protein n=1 Tax=Candidatus Kaiserbacteria bacterium RIFCSPLOWO2_01_FULL_50_24 TaxID=1798507 RepID=A0A1F6EIZ9_9BACT|nr:MAG: hypothetical protein A2673_00175 [Candidatus Kaiserbacteria bacterium RIFCSPHIGHO2_01_FULL_50_13]OGG73600.1 MAG: hypothetical protein A3A34_02910 [Candidatus Kaiserbacteria bacterium RIFCSPLOWO2_01_FULL_50_24]OGG81263.1 MAG: hypothetical protein A3H74_03770 [Candidatus Kaiserbacteria bacterium RIFCSPLOWO2_02_FULL_51_13]